MVDLIACVEVELLSEYGLPDEYKANIVALIPIGDELSEAARNYVYNELEDPIVDRAIEDFKMML